MNRKITLILVGLGVCLSTLLALSARATSTPESAVFRLGDPEILSAVWDNGLKTMVVTFNTDLCGSTTSSAPWSSMWEDEDVIFTDDNGNISGAKITFATVRLESDNTTPGTGTSSISYDSATGNLKTLGCEVEVPTIEDFDLTIIPAPVHIEKVSGCSVVLVRFTVKMAVPAFSTGQELEDSIETHCGSVILAGVSNVRQPSHWIIRCALGNAFTGTNESDHFDYDDQHVLWSDQSSVAVSSFSDFPLRAAQ